MDFLSTPLPSSTLRLKQKGRSIRFQVASSLPMIAGIYAGLVRKLLRDKPNARVVILTPEIERAEEIRRAFLQDLTSTRLELIDAFGHSVVIVGFGVWPLCTLKLYPRHS